MLRTNHNFFFPLLLITSGFHQCQSLINSRRLNRPSGNARDGVSASCAEGREQGWASWVRSRPGRAVGTAGELPGGCGRLRPR